MTLLSWAIVVVPLIYVFWVAFHSRRYVRDVTDYLASGRVAGRYVISVGDVAAGLSVITLVAMVEKDYQTGIAIGFWGQLITPVSLFMGLFGYCVYRFRQTRCLSCGQFLELRYSRSFRIVACTIRTLAEMVTNAIGPAVAVRFFIYFIGLPHRIWLPAMNLPFYGQVHPSIPTYGILVAILLTLALLLIWPAGRISLLVTDCLQGIFCYPIFVIFTVFVLTHVSWFQDMAPVMLDRPEGESFLNPMDIKNLRDFNLFATVVTIMGTILNRAAWIGNDTSTAAKTPHEQKMAGILGTWRNGFSWTMMTLVTIFTITFMLGNRFADQSHDVRIKLIGTVAKDVVKDEATREKINLAVADLPVAHHQIGVDKPYSRTDNPDTPFLNTIHETLKASTTKEKEGEANAKFQEFRTVYNQMMMPTMLGSMFNPVLMGLFTLLMVMLLLTTDDSRIFNASSTIVQDIILPFRTKSTDVKTHLAILKYASLGVTIFFFVVSMFFAQLDYINMFVTIMCAVWLGAAGPIMVGGLYTRFGTTAGAWSALIIGSGIPTFGLFCQRNWADLVYPFLVRHGWAVPIGHFLEKVSHPFNPWVAWKMDAVKFPINSVEIYFLAMVTGVIAYCVVSFLTMKEAFNLDRMLHRGAYADADSIVPERKSFSFRWLLGRIVGIDHEYTTGDKVIAWSVVIWSLVWHFGILFLGVIAWNTYSPWPAHSWAVYFFITTIVTALIVGSVSTVWFMAGGIKDTFALFRDLKARIANPEDNGRVEGHVSIVDAERFQRIEREKSGTAAHVGFPLAVENQPEAGPAEEVEVPEITRR